jgi:hypothetical protein
MVWRGWGGGTVKYGALLRGVLKGTVRTLLGRVLYNKLKEGEILILSPGHPHSSARISLATLNDPEKRRVLYRVHSSCLPSTRVIALLGKR